ncbi:ribonuclease P protein component [Allobaculum mucilyticum]|uniref:ribonuclease P protein component n=1 Tax=Allobaculum mucilyticum TaxID=2834459 RepID=UPI001E460C0A|nr:ribonuclease P protein component [Allobaculum mucilyticum]UNT97342.1 ribonuclease P protein component [Allobaculum mucilyticum]
MKKHQRILKNTEFSSIIQKRKSMASAGFILYTSARKEDHSRIGISVGKKIGKAVVRTRVKRQLRALIDSVFSFDEPFDAIIIVRPPFLKLDYEQREKMLKDLRKRALSKYQKAGSGTRPASCKEHHNNKEDLLNNEKNAS